MSEATSSSAAKRFAIAEINSAGSLHPFLAKLPKLAYSEFGSANPSVPSENLHALSYGDCSFDLIVTSDTLEHVPDVETALLETYRALKPGGAHVLTVPILWGRKSRRRAESVDGKIVHHLSASFHGDYSKRQEDLIVFHEFGDDFIDLVAAAGFEPEVVIASRNPTLTVVIARRPEST